MKFSIITPSYNRLDQIKKACGSVRGQTEVHREHLVMDGNSTDGTKEWLDVFRLDLSTNNTGSEYIFSYRSAPDKGMYDAINNGWKNSTGDVLSWLNCDEQYLPGTLEKVKEIFEKNPNVDIVYGNALIVDKEGNLITTRKELKANLFLIKNTFLNVFSCATFFRRSLFDRGLLKLNDEFRYAADMELILKLMAQKVLMCKADIFFSLFTSDGNNLSIDKQMHDETEVIQNRFRALPNPFRKSIRLLRCLLRLFKGHYKKQEVSYMYALNETPDYIKIHGTANGRFSFNIK